MDDFNDLEPAAATAVVRPCADVATWVRAVVEGRPYDDVATLLEHADELAADWTVPEVERALADHPRIGERHPGGESAELSQEEQAGVDPADADVQSRLLEGNARYEEQFDRIFLVRAKGRSAEEMLDLLEQRLGNDPRTEIEVTAGELREIAALRLAAVFAS